MRKILLAAAVPAALFGYFHFALAAPILPDPILNPPSTAKSQTLVLAGGCFWGVEGVFDHVKGVTKTVAGYAGGTTKNPTYEDVSSGDTGHAESVQITYDPTQISVGQLFKIYFTVATDPTELNYQGPDHGTQYRGAIFFTDPAQQQVAATYIKQLGDAKIFDAPIVTTIEPLKAFYPAEGYHQHYLASHQSQPYIAVNDLPKVANLKTQFPALYTE